jgi:sodium/potassium/calcium exchanger 6
VSGCCQLALIALFFYILATVAERFFCPALENVAAAMRLPEDVAGATLLSFGNGAPDVFAQIAALSQASSEGISLAIGAVLGAGLFVTSVVFPIVVLVSPPSAAHHTRAGAGGAGGGFTHVLNSDGDDDGFGSGGGDGFTGGGGPALPLSSGRWSRLAGALTRGGVEVEKLPFVRDAAFYVVAVAAVLAALLNGDVTLPEASTLGGVYGVYLVVLLAPSRIMALFAAMSSGTGLGEGTSYEAGSRTMGLLDDDEDFDDGYAALIDDGRGRSGRGGGGGPGGGLRWGGGGAGSTTGSHGSMSPLALTGNLGHGAGAPGGVDGAAEGLGSSLDGSGGEGGAGASGLLENMSVEALGGGGEARGVGGSDRSHHQRQRHTWEADIGGDGGGGMGGGPEGVIPRLGLGAFVAAAARACSKTASVLSAAAEAPVLTVLRATMPDLGADPRRQSRLLTSLLPVTAPLFFIAVERFLPTVVTPAGAVYGAVCGSIGAVSLYCAWPVLTGPDAPARAVKIMDTVLTALAFVQSVTWMDATAGELVALLAAVGKVSGVSETLLGATVLAWGNSVGDLVANSTVAREGRPAMAIAACFAGPLFNLLMGLSMGLVAATAVHGTISGLHLQNELVVLSVCLVCSLLHALLAVPLLHDWRVSRGMAVCMLGFYVVFSVVYALIAAGMIFQTQWT